MNRLADAFSGGRSQDIIQDIRVLEKPKEMGEPEAGPVKTTLDLSCFTRFGRKEYRGQKGRWIKVNPNGEIVISNSIGKELPDDADVELFLNKKGTILVMKKCEKGRGLPLGKVRGCRTRRTNCGKLKKVLLDLGLKLPVKFITEWDEELKAWAGKREE